MAQVSAPPKAAAVIAAALGDSGSVAALRRLDHHLAAFRAQSLHPLLQRALGALRAGRREEACAEALRALEIDETCGLAWHILAICREKTGDFTGALQGYEQALALMPDEPEIANDLGRLALKMGMAEIAEQLFAHYLVLRPESVEGINNLACAQRDRMRFDDAIGTLKTGIQANPLSPLLWNALGSVLTLQGEMAQAVVFYDEAVRLDQAAGPARYNRSIARLALGDAEGALEDIDAAVALARLPTEAAGMRVAKAKVLLAGGDLARGWPAYEARLDPFYEDAVNFAIDLPAWTPAKDLTGARLLLIAEQGLGDEVLFAHILPDLVEAVGPQGALALAVDPRLEPLFRRAFPRIEVGVHASGRVDHHAVRTAPFVQGRSADFDAVAPLGSFLARFRGRPDDFGAGAYLRPEPARVAHWRGRLDALPGRKVGIVWKSLVMDADRIRQFAPFAAWAPVLETPDVTFVNLQYGDCAEELNTASALWGSPLWTPPDIDLKDDLDDVAALVCALDLTLGPANATTNIAGACGTPLWLISTPGAWPRLGRPDYPWYPQAKVFTPEAYARWTPAMASIAQALDGWKRT